MLSVCHGEVNANQKAVTAYLKSKQLLSFGFAELNGGEIALVSLGGMSAVAREA